MDQSMVTDYPQVDIPEIGFNHPETQSCIATPAPDKYPMTGETSHKVTVGVFDCMTGKTVYLKAGDPTDRYFTNIAWSPDEQTIYMFELNRDQNNCRLTPTMQKPAKKTANSSRNRARNTWSLPAYPVPALGQQQLYHAEPQGWLQPPLPLHPGKHGSRMASNTESLENRAVDFRQMGSDGSTRLQHQAQEYHRRDPTRNRLSQRNIFAVDTKTASVRWDMISKDSTAPFERNGQMCSTTTSTITCLARLPS